MKQKFANALSLALIVAMLFTSIALADNVQNDVVAGGNDTFTLGGSTTIGYYINSNGQGGFSGCDAADGSAAVVTIIAPPGVTPTPSSLTFTGCGSTQNVVFTASAAGDYDIEASVSDSNGAYNTSPAKFTLHVNEAPPPSDTTAPIISYTVNGVFPPAPDGLNGWYVSDAYLDWTVTDPESSFTTVGCVDALIDYDTAGETLSCSASSAGGDAGPVTVTIKRDATAPTISGSASPASNSAGWNNTDVDVTFTCGDNRSGIVSCGPDATLSSEGAGQSVTGNAEDEAGNTNSAAVSGINIDKTAPVVVVTGVAHGDQYVLGSVPAAGCSTTDALSDVATAASLSMSGGPVGSVTATCSGALDNAGNSNSASVTYSVVYNWSGFFQPIDMGANVWNTVKAGSAIPVKFSLGGDQGLSIFESGYPKFTKVSCTNGTEDAIESTVTAGGSSLTYDALAGQYIYVWKTEKSWVGSCGRLDVKLIDGTTHSANFKFK